MTPNPLEDNLPSLPEVKYPIHSMSEVHQSSHLKLETYCSSHSNLEECRLNHLLLEVISCSLPEATCLSLPLPEVGFLKSSSLEVSLSSLLEVYLCSLTEVICPNHSVLEDYCLCHFALEDWRQTHLTLEDYHPSHLMKEVSVKDLFLPKVSLSSLPEVSSSFLLEVGLCYSLLEDSSMNHLMPEVRCPCHLTLEACYSSPLPSEDTPSFLLEVMSCSPLEVGLHCELLKDNLPSLLEVKYPGHLVLEDSCSCLPKLEVQDPSLLVLEVSLCPSPEADCLNLYLLEVSLPASLLPEVSFQSFSLTKINPSSLLEVIHCPLTEADHLLHPLLEKRSEALRLWDPFAC